MTAGMPNGQPTHVARDSKPGEKCACGLPAVVVYVVTDGRGTRDVPHCGVNRM